MVYIRSFLGRNTLDKVEKQLAHICGYTMRDSVLWLGSGTWVLLPLAALKIIRQSWKFILSVPYVPTLSYKAESVLDFLQTRNFSSIRLLLHQLLQCCCRSFAKFFGLVRQANSFVRPILPQLGHCFPHRYRYWKIRDPHLKPGSNFHRRELRFLGVYCRCRGWNCIDWSHRSL